MITSSKAFWLAMVSVLGFACIANGTYHSYKNDIDLPRATQTVTPTRQPSGPSVTPRPVSTQRYTLIPPTALDLPVSPSPFPTLIWFPPETNDCDDSYPDVCIPPPPPYLDCEDVLPDWGFEVWGPDPHGFDGDFDGIGCEWP